MTTHEERELLSAYLDGELDASDRIRVEQHLPACAACRATLEALRTTVAELRAVPEPVPGEQHAWALRSAIAAARREPKRWQRWAVASSSAAAVAVLIVGGILVAGGGGDRGDTGAAPFAQALTEGGLAADYDAVTAGALLEGEALGGAPARASAPGSETFSTDDAGAQMDLRAARDCRAELFADDPTPRTLRRSLSAAFEGTPAFLLIYEATDPARLELWVVATDDCRNVLFFARRPL